MHSRTSITTCLLTCLLPCLLTCVITVIPAGGGAKEIGFVEDFALASDRTVPLEQLIPGTEDFYYYHCLHFQNTKQFNRVEETLKAWTKRYQYTARVNEIINRQALLTFEQDPQKTLAHLQRVLGLNFNHQRQLLDRKPNLPVQLDQDLISRETLNKRAMASHSNLQGFEPAALDWLVGADLNPDRRRHLLEILQRPDYANLTKLVVDDLNYQHSGGFGSMNIHRQLLLTQLNACLKLKPDLLNQVNFVNAYLSKLQPNPDVDWKNSPEAYEAYLDRLWAYAQKLAPVHNSLKAHVLYHRLTFDRARGVYDAERFMAYLKLPRPVSYAEPRHLHSVESRRYPCNLNADFRAVTLLPPVGDDEPLVRSFLMHFFVEADSFKDYRAYIRDTYLKQVFAETKIVNGLGDPEQWYSLLQPAVYQQLKERIDLDFAFTSKKQYAVDEPVKLELTIKNVDTLIVKVFELNTQNYYRDQLREIDTDINLDGLVANEERTFNYKDPSLRRVRRNFDFPELNKRGVYVIDFIGNGKSSRALIRKGQLRHLVRTSIAGHIFTILDENNQKLNDATLWMAGREYKPDEDGLISVPFSNQPQQQSIVLSHDDFASLDSFGYESENYQLQAGIFVDRESLISRQTSRVLIRPSLRINGGPMPLSELEDVRLRITSVDMDGVSSSQEVADFELHDDRESIHDFQVPQRLRMIVFQLSARIQNVSQNKKVDLMVQESFALNEIDSKLSTEGLHFQQIAGNYFVDVLGKSGEAIADRPVHFKLKHRDFKDVVDVSLQSGAGGRISLGSLADIDWLTATGSDQVAYQWKLDRKAYTYQQVLNGKAGSLLVLPYLGEDAGPRRDQLSLLEVRGQSFAVDHFRALQIKNGMLLIRDLPAGDYDLLIKRSNTRVLIHVADGPQRDRYVLGDHRLLERRGDTPLQIADIDVGEEAVRVKLQNAHKSARLHVFATRYEPAYQPFDFLSTVRDIGPILRILPSQQSAHIAGRQIGDEYRYIIERKYAAKHPGNMLDRPSLLLNPWAIRATDAGQQVAQGGTSYGAAGGMQGGGASRQGSAPTGPRRNVDFATLDFLGEGSAVLVNLKPDEKGVVRIQRELLGPHQLLHFVAVDALETSYRSLSLPEVPREPKDLRLIVGLDPKQHFTQQKQITIVKSDQTLKVDDITSARFESFDSLARTYDLYMTLSKDSKLAEFSFIVNWHQLKEEQQRELYSKYACHELNFFLMNKDQEFFGDVIVPYLKNKKDKTFLDRWLLDQKLDEFARPWNHHELNVVERILLGRRIKAERAATARHVTDLYDLITPDPTRLSLLFNTALQGQQLVPGAQGELEKAKTAASLQMRERVVQEFLMNGSASNSLGDYAASPLKNGREVASALPQLANQPQRDSADPSASKPRRTSVPGQAPEGQAGDSSAKSGEDDAPDAPVMADLEMESREEVNGKYFDSRDKDRRAAQRRLYVKLDKTQEWVENNYYKLPIQQQNAQLVTANAFWNDFASHDPTQPFYSTNLAEASHNFTEMMFALAVLDLPMKGKEPKMEFADAKLTLTATSPLVVFHEQILPSGEIAEQTPILVSQNFFRQSDRYHFEGNQRFDKYVTDEFLIRTVYGCQVVATNPTSVPRKLDILLQTPVGAIPVLNGQQTKSVQLHLQPYQTQATEYYFYFPAPGDFPHFPVHVSQDEKLLAFAAPVTLKVVQQLSEVDRSSWDYLSQNGTQPDVINYLKTNNINRLNLDLIAWRMNDAAFFKQVVSLLAQRHVYNNTLWSYAIKHGNAPAIREYLQYADAFVQQCGQHLVSSLLVIDPVVRKSYEHIDYQPLVNPRSHRLGKQREILNGQLFQQYHRLMQVLSYQRELDDDVLMAVTYYMLLQDRVEEAIGFFDRVNADRLATRMQYDYFAAFINCYREEPKLARSLTLKYADHPVDRWRRAFADVAAQIDEIEGNNVALIDKDNRQQQQTRLAATSPAFDFRVESRKVILNYQNLDKVRVHYYLMDIELLFSGNPFVQEYGRQFSYIRPNLVQQLELDAAQKTKTFELPADLRNSNVLVEITGGGQTKAKAYYANSLDVQVVQDYGQLRVTHDATQKPMSTVYVKVYARNKDGNVKFYKDGYTDLRGRFDFTSLNTNELDFVDRFSLLILSDNDGAIVREAMPPKR